MKYDFTTMLNREGTGDLAITGIPIPGATIKEGFSRIPMWIADMNFATVPTINEEIMKRLQVPAYGYFNASEEYYDSIIRWHKKRNGVEITRDMIGYENGVLGGVISALRVLCNAGGKVLIHAPTYMGFMGSLAKNGYKMVTSQLQRDEEGVWRMDFEDMDRKLKEEKIHVAIMCSPHNPCGRVWERWELEKAMEVFAKNDCYVICDEIWSDLILEDHKHIPLYSISEEAAKRTVTLYAPSKTFNLAGTIGSYHIIPNAYLRDRVQEYSNLHGYNSMNVFSMCALVGAYTAEGEEWCDQLCQVLADNINYACDYISKNFKGVKVSKPEGTYMLLLDCEEWCKEHGKTHEEMLRAGVACGIVWADGRAFNAPTGIRMNLAVPTEVVKEAFDRLDKYVFNA